MKKAEIITQLENLCKETGIPKESFVVVYNGALVINGVKNDTKDIDILVESPRVYADLVKRYKDKVVEWRGHRKIEFNKIGLFDGGMETAYSVDIVAGFRVQTVGSVRAEKFARGRGKDIKDIEVIDRYIINQIFHEHPELKDICGNEEGSWEAEFKKRLISHWLISNT